MQEREVKLVTIVRQQADRPRQPGKPGAQEVHRVRVKPRLVLQQGVGQAGGIQGSLGGNHLARIEAECELVHHAGGDALKFVVKLIRVRWVLILLLEIQKLSMEL